MWQESITWDLSSIWADRGGLFERRYSDCGFGRFGKVGYIRNSSSKNQRERNTKRKWIHIPGTRWYSKIVRKRLRIPRTHSKTETNRKESQPAENNRWRWSPVPTRTSSIDVTTNLEFNSVCGKKKHSPSHQKYCDLSYSHWQGRHARKAYWWLVECRFEQKLVSFLERIHEIHSVERKTSKGTYVVREEIDKSSNDFQTRSCMARSMD